MTLGIPARKPKNKNLDVSVGGGGSRAGLRSLVKENSY